MARNELKVIWQETQDAQTEGQRPGTRHVSHQLSFLTLNKVTLLGCYLYLARSFTEH